MKALQSTYNGVTFRSRTEGRWAVFFEKVGLAWNYEPEGFSLLSGNYLPDFFLPELNLWFEVKPDKTDLSERARFEELCQASEKRGIIAYGPPVKWRENLQFYNRIEWSGSMTLLEDRRDDGIFWLSGDSGAFSIGGFGQMTDHLKLPVLTPRLENAFAAAAAERFGT